MNTTELEHIKPVITLMHNTLVNNKERYQHLFRDKILEAMETDDNLNQLDEVRSNLSNLMEAFDLLMVSVKNLE